MALKGVDADVWPETRKQSGMVSGDLDTGDLVGRTWNVLADVHLRLSLEDLTVVDAAALIVQAIEQDGGVPCILKPRGDEPPIASPGALEATLRAAPRIGLELLTHEGEHLGELMLFAELRPEFAQLARIIVRVLGTGYRSKGKRSAFHARNNRLAAILSNLELASTILRAPPDSDNAHAPRPHDETLVRAVQLAIEAALELAENAKL